VITGIAHVGVAVPNCEEAVSFYRDMLGMTVLSPPYVMDGDAIPSDMGVHGAWFHPRRKEQARSPLHYKQWG
jgi:catechol 2,3-dioxygenase-like lactoylglutathione lyase family enzyme